MVVRVKWFYHPEETNPGKKLNEGKVSQVKLVKVGQRLVKVGQKIIKVGQTLVKD